MDFAAGVLSVWGPHLFYDPILHPPPPLTHFKQYTYSHREGGRANQREEGNSSQSWVENTNMTDYLSSL